LSNKVSVTSSNVSQCASELCQKANKKRKRKEKKDAKFQKLITHNLNIISVSKTHNALVNLMEEKCLAEKEGDDDLVEFLMEQIKQTSAALKATANGNESSSDSDDSDLS